MAQAEAAAALRPRPREVRRAIVGHHALDAHAVARKPGDCPLEEADGIGVREGGQELDVRDPAGVVDTDMGVLPADPAHALAIVAVDAMADPANLAQGFDVDVDELTR